MSLNRDIQCSDWLITDDKFRVESQRARDSDALPPEPLDAAILYAPVGALVPAALRAVRKGGTVVCAGIHMSDIPSFPYAILWEEREICSVANLTRRDGDEFLALAPQVTRPDEEAGQVRQLAQQLQRVTQEIEMLKQTSEAAKNLTEAGANAIQ